MIPSLIKFESADGLTTYEPRDHHNQLTRTRIAKKPLRAVVYKETVDGISYQAQLRVYRLHDRIFDHEKGVLIEVFREEL